MTVNRAHRSTASGVVPFTTGPWTGVLDTADPFDGHEDKLRNLVNGYIPDPQEGSGVYARNGFQLCNNSATVTTAFSPLFCQGVIRHPQLDGTVLNLAIVAGKLLKLSAPVAGVMTVTDITPVGITINSGVGPVYATSAPAVIGGVSQSVLVVNDGLNRPWIASDLANPLPTGTYLDYDGAGSAWTAFGAPVVWQGAIVFILNDVAGVARREDIAWTEPGQPLTGLQQTGFANWMSTVKHAVGPLYALAATNTALYYFRSRSIGAISGDIGPNLASTATNDAIDAGVGTTAPNTMQQFEGAIFFTDVLGRPYRLVPGSAPSPIWHQLRQVVQNIGSNANDQVALYGVSAIEPVTNKYLVGPWRSNVGAASTAPVSTLYVFDAETGNYEGQWTVADTNDGNGGVGINAMGLLEGPDTSDPTLCLFGEAVPGSQSLGFVWSFRSRGFPFPDPAQWLDNAAYPNVQVETDRLGLDPDAMVHTDGVTIITGNGHPCQVTIKAPPTVGSIEGTPVPFGSNDGTFRLVVGAEVAGRGPAVVIRPQPVDLSLGQWSLHRIALHAVLSRLGPEDA